MLRKGERLLTVNWSYGLPGTPDSAAGSFLFGYAADTEDPEAVLRGAIEIYYQELPEGDEARIRGYNPNWGDAWVDIPNEHWAKFGLRPIRMPHGLGFSVDHDETLYAFSE